MSKSSNTDGFITSKPRDKKAEQARIEYARAIATELRLVVCKECSEFHGKAIEGLELILVNCLCDGIVCTSCRAVRIHRPISNYFSMKYLKILHVAYFVTVCRGCAKRRKMGLFFDR